MSQMIDDQAFDQLEYLGNKIRLSRTFCDYADYRDDPDKIAASERARVAHLMRNARPAAARFRSIEELNQAFFPLMFPGYELSLGQLDGDICLVSIEIPYSSEEKVFALNKLEDGWLLIDQFVSSSTNGPVVSARRTEGGLVYTTENGMTLQRSVSSAK